MTTERNVDVLVVGAGPAGSTAARVTARAGLETLVVERKKLVGVPLRCGEYLPAFVRDLSTEVALPVVQRLSSAALHFSDGRVCELRAPGLVINRDEYDQSLARAALRAGAELALGSPMVELRKGGVAQLGGSAAQLIRARLIIGADGPRSLVGKSVGLGNPKVMLAVQHRLPLARRAERAHFYFWPASRFGYGWAFPKGNVANVGVAVPRGQGRQGREALRELSAMLVRDGLIRADFEDDRHALRGGGGLVPCSGPLPRLYSGRTLLAGDAAGQIDPLTGAGIVAAVRGGELAGLAVADALKRERWQAAGPSYESAWRKQLGRAAARSLERRHEMEALWDRDLVRAVTRAWLPRASQERQSAGERGVG